jgi:hypothetical protein
MSQRGAVSLPTLVAVVLGLGFGASAYLNYSQYTRTQQDKKLLNGEITDLKYQVVQDHLGTTPTPSSSPGNSAAPSPSSTPGAGATPSPSQSPAVAGASTQTMTVIEAATLRSADKSSSAPVMAAKVPVGTVVTINGPVTAGGYYPVSVNGSSGFIIASALK